jgi:hypothetical protein
VRERGNEADISYRAARPSKARKMSFIFSLAHFSKVFSGARGRLFQKKPPQKTLNYNLSDYGSKNFQGIIILRF